MSTAKIQREYAGPAILRQGFRPFFLGAGAWAALSLGLWIAIFTGYLAPPTAFDPLAWHVHELLFGYTSAVIAGFLLTAVPNWTKRYPVSGTRVLILFGLWLAGRLAVLFAGEELPVVVAVADLAFPTLLAAAIAREIIAGKNLRNLKVLALLAIFILANAGFHLEAAIYARVDYTTRAGIAAVLLLIMLIGGRIIPSFTRNWLVQHGGGRLPAPFGRTDAVAMAVSGLALAVWTLFAQSPWTAALLLLGGLANAARLGRWAGERTLSEPLVTVLHVAYAFIPLGFAAMAGSILFPDAIPGSAGTHLWTAGAIGTMTMAVMTRASLGHTGQALRADMTINLIYALLVASVLMRFAYGISPAASLLHASAGAWIGAYLLFCIRYWPSLAR